MNERDIWSMVLERLEKVHGFSAITVSLWFDSMAMEKLTPDAAYFSTDNDLKKNIIESKYAPIIKEDLKEILGFDVDVVVISTEKAAFSQQFEEAERRRQSKKLEETVEKLDAKQVKTDDGESYAEADGCGFMDSAAKRSSNVFISPSLPDYSPTYTFDNFVVGNSNSLAYKMALAVAERPAVVANPLFLHGLPGLGKTHLLYAITRKIALDHPEFSIIYTKGEDFTNELVEALANKTPILFREKYRNADVLLIDDIQFIAGKESIQEEFFHTYEALFEAGKQIIVTSDRPPKDIKTLADRLRSRFEHGIIADIQPPDLELRAAIFKRKARDLDMNVPNDVIMYLAENITDNIRQIEGALKKIRALAFLDGTDITMEHAKIAVNDILTAKANAISPEKVISYVSQVYDIPFEDIVGKRRTDSVAFARQVAIYILRELTDLSTITIGKVFNRDYSTIISSSEKIKRLRESDPAFEAKLDDMMKDVKSLMY